MPRIPSLILCGILNQHSSNIPATFQSHSRNAPGLMDYVRARCQMYKSRGNLSQGREEVRPAQEPHQCITVVSRSKPVLLDQPPNLSYCCQPRPPQWTLTWTKDSQFPTVLALGPIAPPQNPGDSKYCWKIPDWVSFLALMLWLMDGIIVPYETPLPPKIVAPENPRTTHCLGSWNPSLAQSRQNLSYFKYLVCHKFLVMYYSRFTWNTHNRNSFWFKLVCVYEWVWIRILWLIFMYFLLSYCINKC